MNNIFVQTVKTSMGIYHRFLLKDNNKFKSIAYMPYKKLSENEYEVTPDINRVISDIYFDIKIKSLEPYDESKKYINVFQNTSKENNVMNYSHGFPVFDDEYDDDITNKNDVNINNVNKDKKINIKETEKEEPKKDKNALF